MDETATLGGWVFGTPACTLEEAPIFKAAPTIRGEDREVPGVEGEAPRRRVAGPIRGNLVVVIHGDFDAAGAPIANPRQGLVTNAEAMKAAVLPTGASPLRTLVQVIDGTAFRAAEAIVVAVDGPSEVSPVSERYSLDVKIPQGGMVVA